MIDYIFSTEPWKHQLAALEFLMPRSYGALYTDMGSGKTKITVDWIVNRQFDWTLVVCPKKVCQTWVEEINKHAFKTPICVIDVSNVSGERRSEYIEKRVTEQKLKQVVVVVNYESVWRSPFREYLVKKNFKCIACDESHKIKSAGSKVSKGLYQIGKKVPNKLLITGTPLGQSPLDIYGQYRFLCEDIFGTNFGNFKERYANMVALKGMNGVSVLDKKNPFKNLEELKEKMFSCAFMMESDVVLPDTKDIKIKFKMSADCQEYYKELKKEGVLELQKGTLQTGNVLALMTRLQQLTSGYIPLEDEEGNVKITEVDDARRRCLKRLLLRLEPDEPVVIFCKYRKDINDIRNTVRDIGKRSSELSGRRNTMKNWIDGNTDVLVIQIASGAEGINGLTKSKYCVYYSLHHSLTLWRQSRKRQHRPGQDRNVTYYTLVATMEKGKTIDEKILEGLNSNQEFIDIVMEDRDI